MMKPGKRGARESRRRVTGPLGLAGLVIVSVTACASPDAARPEAAEAATPADGAPAALAATPREVVTVYKSATCGCCKAWVSLMEDAGFEVVAHDVDDLPSVKAANGVHPEHQSCHTAVVGDYVVEGHVPADVVRRLLAERPDVAGLAVPGMPRGSPGMEVADGTVDAYDVVAFSADGSSSVYATP